MPTVRIPTALKYYVDNHSEMDIPASSVTELLAALATRYPSLKFHLLDSDGNLRRHFTVFVNGEHIRDLNGLDIALGPDDKIILLASAAGG
ncbi:MAG: molybdopterin synthase sulfur carrier subunit [Anaerolineaceae bacterium]|nr:MAG: molybdopterin synthase sulfur carrier subunit [Anaerolineaceae bacterium]